MLRPSGQCKQYGTRRIQQSFIEGFPQGFLLIPDMLHIELVDHLARLHRLGASASNLNCGPIIGVPLTLRKTTYRLDSWQFLLSGRPVHAIHAARTILEGRR